MKFPSSSLNIQVEARVGDHDGWMKKWLVINFFTRNVLCSSAANLLIVMISRILPGFISTSIGEHGNLETLRELLTLLATNKRSLDISLEEAADVITNGASLVSVLLPDAWILQRQLVGEL